MLIVFKVTRIRLTWIIKWSNWGFLPAPQTFFCTSKNYSFDSNGGKKNVKRILTFVSLFFLWNECRDLFYIFLKQISTSISLFFFNFFFVKRMSRSVSHFSETDLDICFIFFLLWNRCQNSFLIFPETDLDIRFIIFFCFFFAF